MEKQLELWTIDKDGNLIDPIQDYDEEATIEDVKREAADQTDASIVRYAVVEATGYYNEDDEFVGESYKILETLPFQPWVCADGTVISPEEMQRRELEYQH